MYSEIITNGKWLTLKRVALIAILGILAVGCEKEAVTTHTAFGTRVSRIHVIDVVTGQCIRIEEGGIERNEYTHFVVVDPKECER